MQKGFTIIELIVVIAIIAVLAAIVLVNVTGFINKGKDAAIKGNLSSLMTDAAVVFEKTGTYNNTSTNVCATYGYSILNAISNVASGLNALCYANGTNWCTCSGLVTNKNNAFCVDSTGKKTMRDISAGNCYTVACNDISGPAFTCH